MRRDNTTEIESDDLEGKSLRDYLHLVQKYWWVMVLVVGIGVTGTVLFTLRQPKMYRASAAVVINPQPPQVFGSQVQEVITLGTGSFWSNQEYYNTQVQIVGSFDLARMTIDHNGLIDEPGLGSTVALDIEEGESPESIHDKKLQRAAITFASGLSATHHRDSRIVAIDVTLEDPHLAERLANLHIDTFLEYTRGLRSGGTGKISKYLSTELDRAEKQLEASEQAVIDFKRNNNLLSTSLEESQSILAKELSRYTLALGDVRIKRTEQGTALKRARKLVDEDILESPIFALAEDGRASELRAQYTIEDRKMLAIAEQYGPKHDLYKGQKEQVSAALSNLKREARRLVREMEVQHQASVATERKFQEQLDVLKAQAMDLAPKTAKYNQLKRKQATDSLNYESLRQRLRTSDMTGRNEAINIRSHSRARGAVLVSPIMSRNVGLAIVLALCIGFGIAFLLDLMDRTVKTADQVEAVLKAPVLGVIPIVTGGTHDRLNPTETKERDLHIFANPNSQAAECCRAIRTNILFAGTDKRMKTLTISSPRPREGKSTTTIYLGTTMAQSGQRVLLVDADLRRPRLHKAMNVSRENGLTTVLLGEATLDEAIKSTEVPGLYVLPAGPQPPNPAELLLTDAFAKVLEQLEERFDRILLDSPPLLAVSDPVVLSRLSDGVLLVLQSGKTRIDDALNGVRDLRSVNAPIVGIILNDINLDDRRYGYGSKYYSYGYGEDARADA